jgi:hypothetical protein
MGPLKILLLSREGNEIEVQRAPPFSHLILFTGLNINLESLRLELIQKSSHPRNTVAGVRNNKVINRCLEAFSKRN